MKPLSLIAAVLIAAISPLTSQAVSDVIAKIEAPYPDVSGIAVNQENRVFLGLPRYSDEHDQPALMELIQGKLRPYPNSALGHPQQGNYTNG